MTSHSTLPLPATVTARDPDEQPWTAHALALVNASPGWRLHARSATSRVGLSPAMAAWFADLSAPHRARVIADTTFEEFAPRATVSFASAGDAWIGVIEGLAVITRQAAPGLAMTNECVQPGCWMEQARLLDAKAQRQRCWALRRLVLARMPASTFHWLLHSSGAFAASTCRRSSDTWRSVNPAQALDLTLPADTRVARALLNFARAQASIEQPPTVRLAQREIGALCQLPRQRVNKAIARLSWRECVATEYGGVRILDMAQLERAAQ